MSTDLERAPSLPDVYTIALEGLADLLAVERAAVLGVGGRGLSVLASRGLSPALEEAVERHMPWAPDVREPVPVLLPEGAAGLPEALARLAGADWSGALVFLPLTTDARLVGALLVVADRGRDFTEAERLSAGLLASAAAARMVHAPGSFGAHAPAPRDNQREQASRNEALSVLARGVAHDFNNILTAIVMNLGVAERFLEASHPARPYAASAARACDHAKTITRQLHTFAQGGAVVRTATALPTVLHASAGLALQGSASRATVDVPGGLWRVAIDEEQLGRVVHVLVTNALEAMPDGGHVRIAARNVEVGAADRLPVAPGRYVVVTVHDQGPGIAAEHLDRIFDPYFTTKPSSKGLGLATSFAVLHRQGGHMGVECPPEGGASFTIHLPAADESDADAPGHEQLGLAFPTER